MTRYQLRRDVHDGVPSHESDIDHAYGDGLPNGHDDDHHHHDHDNGDVYHDCHGLIAGK